MVATRSQGLQYLMSLLGWLLRWGLIVVRDWRVTLQIIGYHLKMTGVNMMSCIIVTVSATSWQSHNHKLSTENSRVRIFNSRSYVPLTWSAILFFFPLFCALGKKKKRNIWHIWKNCDVKKTALGFVGSLISWPKVWIYSWNPTETLACIWYLRGHKPGATSL